MLCAPPANEEVVKLAVLLLTVTGEPRVPVPSLNCTVPAGVPEAGAVTETVAVNVTDCPLTEGFTDEETAVEVFPCTTSVAAAAWLRLAYVPVMLSG